MRVLFAILVAAFVSLPAAPGANKFPGRTPPEASAVAEAGADEHCSRDTTADAEVTVVQPRLSFADRSERVRRTAQLGGTAGPCSSAEFAALEGAALVEALATAGSCLESLWNLDDDVITVIAPANLTLVAAEIVAESADLALNASRVQRLAYFYQIAFYHEAYASNVNYDAATALAAQQALVAVASSQDFLDDSVGLFDLRQQWTASIDSTNGSHLAVDVVHALLQRFVQNPALAVGFQERLIAFRCLNTISRQVLNRRSAGEDSPWYDLVSPELLATIGELAHDTSYTSLTEYLVNNAIFVLGSFTYLNAETATAAHETMSSAYATHGSYTGPWFRTLIDLEQFFDGQLSDGTPIDYAQIRSDVLEIALPHTYSLDDGHLRFRTALDRTTVGDLHDAIGEVRSQFFRKTTLLDPVTGDSNAVLTLVVYGSRADYELYQPFLYGLNTSNGGIYIEGVGTLFTYDRTPQESIYTLEELLRHEYVHYLDGRFVVVPLWGQGVYAGERLTWYTEGVAEYLAGSTRTEGVLPRGVLVERIEADSSRMTVEQVVNASYLSGFRFYRYAGMLFEFMDDQRPELLTELFDRVRADNPFAIDALFDSMAADAGLQQAFDDHLDLRIDQLGSGSGLFAEEVPTTPAPQFLPVGGQRLLRMLLDSELSSAAGHLTVGSDRFRYSGLQSFAVSGTTVPRVQLDAQMDELLERLTPAAPNFTSAVAWFGNIEISGNTATASYVIEGPYRRPTGRPWQLSRSFVTPLVGDR